jgi:hypothetical protein
MQCDILIKISPLRSLLFQFFLTAKSAKFFRKRRKEFLLLIRVLKLILDKS